MWKALRIDVSQVEPQPWWYLQRRPSSKTTFFCDSHTFNHRSFHSAAKAKRVKHTARSLDA